MHLDKQVEDFNRKVLEIEGLVKEWQPKRTAAKKVVRCGRNINATSTQNALVNSLSPDLVIVNDAHKKCCGCSKPIYC